jgi:hypothetical protein
MKWFLAKMVYRIICGSGNHKPQFDEQLRLVTAGNASQAFEKAIAFGKMGEDRFHNQNLQLVQWQFVNISELHELQAVTDGAELHSAIQEVENAEAFIRFVHHKAGQLAGDNN